MPKPKAGGEMNTVYESPKIDDNIPFAVYVRIGGDKKIPTIISQGYNCPICGGLLSRRDSRNYCRAKTCIVYDLGQ
ncbi:MAG: hypothetical protein A3K30_03880 [Deltaproteobacteria bacterium RBG_13_51_10]|nr:MAG: hypothetical protein A3K30_03880 [Deltaproteobacteria bacterium RBG_13_51_10]